MAFAPVYSQPFIIGTGDFGELSFEVNDVSVIIVRDIDVVVGTGIGASWWAYDTDGCQFAGGTFDESVLPKNWQGWRGRQVIWGPGFVYLSVDAAVEGARMSGYVLGQT